MASLPKRMYTTVHVTLKTNVQGRRVVLSCKACKVKQPTMENCFQCFARKVR